MKKVITLALALLMVCSMSVTAFAATTTLTTTVPEATYTLNIPANQEIPFGTTSTNIGNITVTDANGFAIGKDLQVAITYDAFTSEGVVTQIPYTLSLYAESNNEDIGDISKEIPSGEKIIFQGKADGTAQEKIMFDTPLGCLEFFIHRGTRRSNRNMPVANPKIGVKSVTVLGSPRDQ